MELYNSLKFFLCFKCLFWTIIKWWKLFSCLCVTIWSVGKQYIALFKATTNGQPTCTNLSLLWGDTVTKFITIMLLLQFFIHIFYMSIQYTKQQKEENINLLMVTSVGNSWCHKLICLFSIIGKMMSSRPRISAWTSPPSWPLEESHFSISAVLSLQYPLKPPLSVCGKFQSWNKEIKRFDLLFLWLQQPD